MGLFIKDLVKESPHREDYQKLESNVLNCASYLVFNNYYTIDEVKLSKAQTCKKHMLCPFCARRRAAKMVEKNVEKFDQVLEKNKKLIPAMLTVTVKNGDSLEERYQHIKDSFRKLQQRRRDYIKKGRGFSEFCKIEGAVFSYEITHSEEKKWHPHIHAVVLLNEYIDVKKFSQEWEKITGDSYIVDIRKISKKSMSSESTAIADAMCEVFKYALKFSDLTLERQFEAYETLKGQRMLGAFGLLHGVKVPESLLDDLNGLEDLPYIEMFYSFRNRKGVYDLTNSEHREPKSALFNREYEIVPCSWDVGGGAAGHTDYGTLQGEKEKKRKVEKDNEMNESTNESNLLSDNGWSWQTPYLSGKKSHILISDWKEGITLCEPNNFGPECVPTGYLNFNEKPKCKKCAAILHGLIPSA